jgi:hypothetical protein
MKAADPGDFVGNSRAALILASWLGLSIWAAGLGALALFF